MNKCISIVNNFLMKTPSWKDAILLILFTVLITAHPYYLNDRINLFELGLYLPGINGILHGLMPYRDFFHLRGPLELYVPAVLMQIFGTHMQVLCAYFFFGNVLCLVFIVLIAKELIRSRYMLYLMIPVAIARSYPRVCFMIWGGMRYCMGLVVIFCLIKFLKTKKNLWILLAGFSSAIAGLISIEMAAYSTAAVLVCFIMGALTRTLGKEDIKRGLVSFIGAGLIGILPWIIYALTQGALISYINAFWVIVTRMQVVIDPHLVSIYPHNFPEALAAMLNPISVNFKHMTPAYLYVVLLGYLMVRLFKGRWGVMELCLLSLGVYGFIMYNTGFRGLWAAQFEMSLMPEKILYFFLVEAGLLWLWGKVNSKPLWQKAAVSFVIIALFISSWGYALARYNHRFWAFQYSTNLFNPKKKEQLAYRDKNEKYAQLTMERVKGIWVPVDQHKDLNQLELFIKTNTSPHDAIVMFPELGTYNFLFDRPFVGRFPITTFSWFDDRWFDEYLQDLKEEKAEYVIVQKRMTEDWYQVYLGYPPSKIKYNQMLEFIHTYYTPVAQTDLTEIFKIK